MTRRGVYFSGVFFFKRKNCGAWSCLRLALLDCLIILLSPLSVWSKFQQIKTASVEAWQITHRQVWRHFGVSAAGISLKFVKSRSECFNQALRRHHGQQTSWKFSLDAPMLGTNVPWFQTPGP